MRGDLDIHVDEKIISALKNVAINGSGRGKFLSESFLYCLSKLFDEGYEVSIRFFCRGKDHIDVHLSFFNIKNFFVGESVFSIDIDTLTEFARITVHPEINSLTSNSFTGKLIKFYNKLNIPQKKGKVVKQSP